MSTTDIDGLATGLPISLDGYRAPANDTECRFVEVLVGVVGTDRVSVDSNFFDDLDADSMVMTQFCARVRKQPDLPSVSMKDIYRHPTIAGLAAALGQPTSSEQASVGSAVSGGQSSPAVGALPVVQTPSVVETPCVARTPGASNGGYVLCGVLQALIALAGAYLASTILDWGFTWLTDATDLRVLYVRAVGFGTAALLGMCVLPIVGKWVLIGRWKPGTIGVWTLGYARFWCVKILVRSNPLVLFAGSPIYSVYLRLLGAKIGRGVVVYSPTPVCTDLLTVGADSVVGKDAQLPGYRAVAGVIEIGPVTLGSEVIVGEQVVIDIDTEMREGARLGHSSSLHAGQRIPAGQYWYGSPARPTDTTDAVFPQVDPARCGTRRRVLYSLWQLVIPLGVYVPLLLGAPVLLAKIPQLAPLLNSGPVMLTHPTYYRDIALITVAACVGFVIANFVFIMIVARLLNLGLTPGRVYPLYGFRYWLARTITRRTNSAFFTTVFGDSSYIVHYLRALGYDLGTYEQTGSNFGTAVKHDNPYLCSVGAGTMVADGLSMINIDYSSTSFRLSAVAVGARSFLGNAIAYPAHARVGDNCLLATKVMVPAEGPVCEGVGLLGAPSFAIPRTVERDHQLEVSDPGQRRRRLRAKNRHNTVTIALLLASRWFPVFLTVLLGETSDLNASMGAWALTVFAVASTLIGLVYLVGLQRAVNWSQALRPTGCSIYDRAFWRHERYWKIPGQAWMQTFNGTPLKPLIWRALGVRIGRRVFDDGLRLVEKTFVTIGDDATLNAGCVIQCHSQEDGAFKSDRTTLGAGVTLGIGAFVHYGVTIDDGAVLAPDTFVMKGEEIPARTRWSGNPAAPDTTTAQLPASSARLGGAPALALAVAASPAAPAEQPHAILEWTGHGWTFPEFDHYTDALEGPVARLRINQPGALRLTGHGDRLRMELIPDADDRNATVVGLPPADALIALPDTDKTGARPLPVHRAVHTPYAAGLVLIAMLAAAAVLTGSHDIMPPTRMPPTRAQTPPPGPSCVAGISGCETTAAPEVIPPAPGLFALMIPSGLDTVASATDTEASTPHMNHPPPDFFAVAIPPDLDTTQPDSDTAPAPETVAPLSGVPVARTPQGGTPPGASRTVPSHSPAPTRRTTQDSKAQKKADDKAQKKADGKAKKKSQETNR